MTRCSFVTVLLTPEKLKDEVETVWTWFYLVSQVLQRPIVTKFSSFYGVCLAFCYLI